MPLDKNILESGLKNLFDVLEDESKKEGATPESIKQKFAEDLASLVDTYIKTGTVSAGISVQVDPNTGIGATTGTGVIT